MSSPTDEHHTDESQEPAQELYKYLLLLGILVATVTCTAGLDPPGGLWQESKDGHRTGDPIMNDTRRARYTVFYIFNSSAFLVSLVLVVYLLLLSAHRDLLATAKRTKFLRLVLKAVVLLDLILLVVAFVAGSCRGSPMTIYASVHCGGSIIVAITIVLISHTPLKKHDEVLCNKKYKESRMVLMLLAIFATTVTYTASLTPPGGFWEHAPAGEAKHRAGDPILLERDLGRMVVFFVGNTTAFIMSVVIMMLLLLLKLTKCIYGLCCSFTVLVMLGLAAAYTASVWRHPKTYTIIIIISFLVGGLLYFVFHLVFPPKKTGDASSSPVGSSASDRNDGPSGGQAAGGASPSAEESSDAEDIARDLILLLAIMVATVTYQGGLQPPGGVWRGSGQGHSGGGLILLVTHAAQYKVFFFFNTAAFVTSVAVVIMVQSRSVSQRALEAAVILDLLGLMGAYAAGTIRGHHTWSFACVLTLAAAVFIFLFLVASLVHQKWQEHQMLPALQPVAEHQIMLQASAVQDKKDKDWNETRREVLMLLAIMAITITYQAGLTPPGKFWLERGDGRHHAGDPVLVDTYPLLYGLFFFSNTATFMMSVVVILFLVSRKLDSVGRRWWCALFVYTFLLLGLLMATFIAGTKRRMPSSRATFAVIITAALALQAGTLVLTWWKYLDFFDRSKWWFQTDEENKKKTRGASDRYREYLVGVSILAASVAYQAGLSPPGGIWPDDGHGHAAGNPVLYDTGRLRYLAFHYCNTASFAASIAVSVLLLLDVLWPKRFPLPKRHTYIVLVLDVLGLLMAYATGSSRDKGTWMYVLAMATAILAYIAIYKMLLPRGNPSSVTQQGGSNNLPASEQTLL